MGNYIDRGLMKWAPFDALAGHSELIAKLKMDKLKKEKPTVDEDRLADMNIILLKAYKNKEEIKLTYFKDGAFLETYGYIDELDFLEKSIKINTGETFSVTNVINIEGDI